MTGQRGNTALACDQIRGEAKHPNQPAKISPAADALLMEVPFGGGQERFEHRLQGESEAGNRPRQELHHLLALRLILDEWMRGERDPASSGELQGQRAWWRCV